MKILFLDDEEWRYKLFTEKHPGDEISLVRDPDVAIALLKQEDNIFDEVWLDHDLGYYDPTTDPTGYTVACYIEEHPEVWPRIKRIILHSHNPAGVERMAAAIRKTTIRGNKQPFCFIYGSEITTQEKETGV